MGGLPPRDTTTEGREPAADLVREAHRVTVEIERLGGPATLLARSRNVERMARDIQVYTITIDEVIRDTLLDLRTLPDADERGRRERARQAQRKRVWRRSLVAGAAD